MKEYETVCILKPDLPVASLARVREKIQKILTDSKSEVITEKDWGKRKLAYPIAKGHFGHYLYYNYLGTGEFIPELERTFKNEEGVIRYLTVKVSEKATKETAAAAKRASLPEDLKFGGDERPQYEGHRGRDEGGHYAEENL